MDENEGNDDTCIVYESAQLEEFHDNTGLVLTPPLPLEGLANDGAAGDEGLKPTNIVWLEVTLLNV